MLDLILGHLRIVCRLLAVYDKLAENNNNKVLSGRFARTYGPGEIVQFSVIVRLWPIYPDYNGYKPSDVLKGKVSRRKLANRLESEVAELLVGYRTEVSLENRSV